LSERLEVEQDQLIFGAGSEELLHYLAIACIEPQNETVMGWPSFSVYDITTNIMGGRAVKVPLNGQFALDLPAMLVAVGPKTRIVYVCNPNNPTATVVEKAALEDFLLKIPPHVVVVMDEAYFEYVDPALRIDGIEYLRKHNNILVLRTFSKAYGLAGLRIGFGVGSPGLIASMAKVRGSFNVHRLAQAAALAALDDHEYLENSVRANDLSKEFLYARFEEMGLSYVRSQANFILLDAGIDCSVSIPHLLKAGVILRPGSLFGYNNYLRVSVGGQKENERFIDALRELLLLHGNKPQK
ncbi:MAG: aminotransferase class I/II-fold pyridoxal phosphate-dependent enzyme, partial [Clostridiales bacterium]|nr:aminotransferase class I/II-fold pyridoxal phosphate-dependent enzyme [Clostridiales bacterium]